MRWPWIFVSGLVAAAAIAAESAAPAQTGATGAASAVKVTVTSSSCRLVPARVSNGAIRFTIVNRSKVPQRFSIAGKAGPRVTPGEKATQQLALDRPGVYAYRCTPTKGATRRGSFRVARAVVVESDMDPSAAMAILYLLKRDDVDVRAIVVDGDGEARCPAGATNALSLTALAGKPKIPVGCGRPLPLQGTHAFPAVWRDYTDGFYGLPRPAQPLRALAGTGDQVYRSALASAPGRMDVVTDGPPTELAAVISESPALRTKIRSVTMMAGAVGVPGNMTWPPEVANPYSEWNAWVDPHAVNLVLRSGVPVTLVPLDATNQVPLNSTIVARLGSSPTATYVRQLIGSVLTGTPSGADSTRFYFWDPLTAAVLVDPAIGRYESRRLAVVETEGKECGRVVAAPDGGQVRVATSVDRTRFESSFVSTMR